MFSMLPSFLIGVVLGAICTYTIHEAMDLKGRLNKQKINDLVLQNETLRDQIIELRNIIAKLNNKK